MYGFRLGNMADYRASGQELSTFSQKNHYLPNLDGTVLHLTVKFCEIGEECSGAIY